jgi:hypothetical protein
VVLTAFRHYGLIVADNGSNWYFQGSADPTWDPALISELKTIPASAFEAVDESSLMVDPNSGRVHAAPPATPTPAPGPVVGATPVPSTVPPSPPQQSTPAPVALVPPPQPSSTPEPGPPAPAASPVRPPAARSPSGTSPAIPLAAVAAALLLGGGSVLARRRHRAEGP